MRSRSSALLIICALVVAVGLPVVGYLLGSGQSTNSSVIAQIQKERQRNSLASCQQTNREHAALLGFIEASIPRERRSDKLIQAYLARAARSFPQRDCAVVVRRQVKH